jgi:hypothetical protein
MVGPLASGPYQFTVRATNATGQGARSAPTAPVTADSVAPSLTARTPAVNAQSVSPASNVVLTLSEPVTGVSNSSVSLTNVKTNQQVAAAITALSGNRFQLHPSTALVKDTKYVVALTSTITDLAGNPLKTVTWTFVTGPAPTVTAKTPGVNATSISRVANMVVTFSELMSGVTTSTFSLRNVTTGRLVAATVSRRAGTNQWTLNPSATLPAKTRFTVTVTGSATAIRDAAANPLTTLRWTFTTGP